MKGCGAYVCPGGGAIGGGAAVTGHVLTMNGGGAGGAGGGGTCGRPTTDVDQVPIHAPGDVCACAGQMAPSASAIALARPTSLFVTPRIVPQELVFDG
jgi:hypothetical protein